MLDKRINAYRDDLADERLRPQVHSARYVTSQPMQVRRPVAAVHKMPAMDSMQTTQALMGEIVQVFDRQNEWAWGQLADDRYVGYIGLDNLSESVCLPTHRVTVPATLIYPVANLKSQPARQLYLNARVTVAGHDGDYAALRDGGFVFAAHLADVTAKQNDFVGIAEQFLHVPYLWGGKSAAGLDCSGLVQVALQACGIACPRDSDMQEECIGNSIAPENFRRGDLVFWDGHVGIMRDATNLLHASGRHMMVENEPLKIALSRFAATGKRPTTVRRIDGLYG